MAVSPTEEVVTTDDEDDVHNDTLHRHHLAAGAAAVAATRAPEMLRPTGSFETLHNPDEPRIDEALPSPRNLAAVPLSFFVRISADPKQRHKLCKITLPASWASATVGRVVELLAKRASLPSWDCHLSARRGDLGNSLLVHAAIARRETVELAAGPPCVAPAVAEAARTRRTCWLWGRGIDGVVEPVPRRHPLLGVHSVLRLGLGDEHVCVVTTTGLALTWGFNDCGQLGTGDEIAHATPRVVRALTHTRCVEVSCGARCTGLIDADAELWTFGANQPANRPLRFHESWANAYGATACGRHAASLAFGLSHCLLLTRSGELWTWGYNDSLQLGWADAVGSAVLRAGFQKPRHPLPGLPSGLASVACGEAHSACVSAAGEVYAWGDNTTGQCALGGGPGAVVAVPTLVRLPSGDTSVRRVRCHGNSMLVITSAGRAYMFGGGGRIKGPREEEDESGSGSDADEEEAESGDANEDRPDPEATADGAAKAREAGGQHAGGQHAGGQQQAQGAQDGVGRGLGSLLGARLLAERVHDAAGCEDHALLLDTNGGLRGLGYNRYSQACPGNPALRLSSPAKLPADCFSHQRVVGLAAGGGCSMAVTEARESLLACAAAVLQSCLEAGDAERCAQVLATASACDTPALASLGVAAEECIRRKPSEVAECCRELGIAEVDSALKTLMAMRTSGEPAD